MDLADNHFFLEEEMFLARRDLDSRSRRLIAFGFACLGLGLALRIFVHPVALNEKILLHTLVGVLLGLFIGLEGFAVQSIWNCRADRS